MGLLTAQAGTSDQLVRDTTLGSATSSLPGLEVSAGKATMLTMVILQTTTDTGTRKRQGQFSPQASSTRRYFSTFLYFQHTVFAQQNIILLANQFGGYPFK